MLPTAKRVALLVVCHSPTFNRKLLLCPALLFPLTSLILVLAFIQSALLFSPPLLLFEIALLLLNSALLFISSSLPLSLLLLIEGSLLFSITSLLLLELALLIETPGTLVSPALLLGTPLLLISAFLISATLLVLLLGSAALLTAEVIERRRARELAEPGPRAAAARVEAVPALQGPGERLGCQVFGHVAVSGQVDEERVHVVEVALGHAGEVLRVRLHDGYTPRPGHHVTFGSLAPRPRRRGRG